MNEKPSGRFSWFFWRFAVLGFALSLILPSPSFLRAMSKDAFVVWLFRLAWVVGLSAGIALLAGVAGRLWFHRPDRDDESGTRAE